MKAFLIDFENVKSRGMNGIEYLGEDDRVIIFYSENSDTLSFEMHRKVLSSKAHIEYLKVNVGGKNALDFQLCSLLGYMVGLEKYSHIFVISNDKGFDKLHDFWNITLRKMASCFIARNQHITAALNYANTHRGLPAAYEVPEDDTAPQEEIPEPIEAIETDEPVAEKAKAVEETESAEAVEAAEPIEAVESTEISENASDEPHLSETENVTLPAEALNEEHENAWAVPAEESGLSEDIRVTKIPKQKKKNKRGRPPKPVSVQVKNSLTGFYEYDPEDIDFIVKCIADSESKEDFHNALAKKYKQDGMGIYKILRPKYNRLKEILTPAADEADVESKAENTEPAPISEQPAAESEAAENPDKLTAALNSLLAENASEDEIARAADIFKKADAKQKIYLSMIKVFKRERGCEIYKLVKSECNSLLKLAQPQEA